MTLPTFLGIGVPRAGTTWLHTLLAGHPDVYLPTRRKEIRFFDRYHDLGTAWYEAFFAAAEAIGRSVRSRPSTSTATRAPSASRRSCRTSG